MPRIAYVNGSFVPLEDAKISILDRGFLFADGIYEVAAVLDGLLVDYDAHAARLQRSCNEIKLNIPVDAETLLRLHHELREKNELTEGLIYLQVTRGAAERDFAFPDAASVPSSLVMFTKNITIRHASSAKTGIKVVTVPDLRWQRRDIKSIALLAQVLAKQTAAENGAGEAWMLEDGHITEGSSSTAFIITKNGTLITRQLSNAVLPSCTRKAVLALARESQITVEERPFTLQEAYNAAEAFICSATALVMPVVQINDTPIGTAKPGALTLRLRELYLDFAVKPV